MSARNNYIKRPYNFFQPRTIRVDNRDYTYYLVRFNDLYEIYDYLIEEPEINKNVFCDRLSSVSSSANFGGLPYDEAVKDLINFKDTKYFDFLELSQELTCSKIGIASEYRDVLSVAGGHLNNVLFSMGDPFCYESVECVSMPKFITIYAALSYSSTTTKYHLLHRSIALISVINELEKHGYIVDLKAFEMSRHDDEIVNIVVGVKDSTERVNLQTLYKTSCKIEFLRRILFRVLETLPVKTNWSHGYGDPCPKNFVRQILDIKDEDIYFGTPQELEIGGGNLEKDLYSCLKNINLTDEFDIKTISKETHAKIKKLI